MYDLSAFMKLLKQRFTQWFNRMHQRKGTLWEERFRSVLIEGPGPALATTAAYIDLNPVRAGLVDDPKDYRWCGYAEAVAGQKEARAGLATSLGVSAEAALSEYRQWLYIRGEEREGPMNRADRSALSCHACWSWPSAITSRSLSIETPSRSWRTNARTRTFPTAG